MKFRFLFLLALLTVLLPQKDLFAYGITSIGGSGWSGTLNYSANSTVYTCYNSGLTLYTDVTASTTVSGTIYYRKWQYCTDAINWYTDNLGGSSYSTHATISRYYRCVQRSTGGVVLAGSETPWVRIIFGPSYVAMPSAVSTTGYTGTQFDAHWTTSSTPHGPGTLNIRHYMFCSSTPDFLTPAPGFNSACAKLITACSDASSAIAGCTNPSSSVTYTVTGLTPGVTYYWKVLAQSWHEESSNGDLWCGVQSSYTVTQTVSGCSVPQVSTHPATQTACEGDSITFSVTASGTAPFSYQWKKNGSDITNAINQTYTINPVTSADAGSYTVYITNSCGNVTSNAAVLTVNALPVITSGPSDSTVCEGTSAAFSITATGTVTSYQWQVSSDGGNTYTNITAAGSNPAYSGWTSTSLGLNSPVAGNNGNKYRCIVNGNCASPVVSEAASLIVQPGLTAGVSIVTDTNPSCTHALVTFTAVPVNGGTAPAYQWYLNNTLVSTNSTYSNNVLFNGDSVKCRLTSNAACVLNSPVWSATTHMVINQIPITEAGATATYTDTPVQIGDQFNGPGVITWSPAAGLNNTWIAQPLASPTVTTTYTLSINNFGCLSTDTVTVYVGGTGHAISGKTRYLKKATAGNPTPNMPTYNAVLYNIDNVEVKLKSSPAGALLATTMSDASGYFQFTGIADGNYILSYDHIPYDTMQYSNQVNAVDLALMKYLIGHDTLTDPSRSFTIKHKKAGNVDNNGSLNSVDIARISAKIGLPYDPARNYPKGNWLALDTSVTVAGSDLNVTLQTVAYGDYDASSYRYKDSTTSWGMAKVLPDENIILRSDESIMINDPAYFEVPLRISTKMNKLASVGLELSYASDKYKLVIASMSNTGKKSDAIKINPSLEEIIAANNDLLVTDDQGIIRVVYATTDYFDVAANDELLRLGFRSLNEPGRGTLDFDLNGTGLIANQYGEINENAYLTMPKIFAQGDDTKVGFEFAGYPNPFSDAATLTYSIPENGTVKLNVYNAIGELLTELVNEAQISGGHSVVFSQKNLSEGMYTFKLEFTGLNKSKCLVLKMIR